jgi:hypothetical protein
MLSFENAYFTVIKPICPPIFIFLHLLTNPAATIIINYANGCTMYKAEADEAWR